ncbi:5'-nucleotidase C-terminal domain-containing protein [Methyloversatilis sp.]|uniref:5'-nucleotidase C-terminal domain-containing protein n=1 Tax=Methyloversatilis sp. TaxID=2569862 RepID=UPI002736D51F|nr:5'-nucleotidase C-terminal domain-containing protein [Methyloversatilis sp.]MDP2870246.1 5'-nucleotidase C-terminal domain-containing protein [Methyloversatilis sp.]MDP3456360.1 5'-nucleotidase C-terminal domain-containing protein [Methyloversatilis sp.]MDP3579494.1 5'-nucleotidase C-terminal domain-containing protein [Methyloversatilis sp.]
MNATLVVRKHTLAILISSLFAGPALAEGLTLLHVGDQESWLLSAQGNLRDNASQAVSFYGGVDRLASVMFAAESAAELAGNTVFKLNAGDAFLPGPRLNASFANLGSAYIDGGQDFYDAIAMRHIGFDAAVFGNHEFDLGPDVAARFAQVSGTTYLSSNLNFSATPAFASLAATGTVAPYTLLSTNGGNKVAVVGVTTPRLPNISSPGAVNLTGGWSAGNTETQNLQALVPFVQQQIDAARAEGAGSVIVISHLQNAANERDVLIPGLRGVDVVLSGGGHELMADADDVLIPNDVRAITGLPQMIADADGKGVAMVTSNFGNRYVGELNLTLHDTTGVVTAINGANLYRVSGAQTDAVVGDSFLKTAVVDPVQMYVNDLNATVIGTSDVFLNGARGAAGTPGSFQAGVRNAETNLGNLVADAMRHAGGTDIAIQNGGGIRTSISVGNVSVGNTFDVLPFTNLVDVAPSVDAEQLKTIMEHSVANASASGSADGRFAQVSGMRVVYDTTRASGDRIVSIVLDDGTVLVQNGEVVEGARSFSLTTIDFTANGGDGYPFAAAGIEFENAVSSITYQQALQEYITDAISEGGLGGVISASRYGVADPLDPAGRLVDLAISPVPEADTWAMLLAGLGLLGVFARRRNAVAV